DQVDEYNVPENPERPGTYQWEGLDDDAAQALIGLANDEVGYIVPKRQWDEKPPYCYGRDGAQYGEGNSVGPETARILTEALADLVRAVSGAP
ncbi:MAG: hypothetical protein IH919_10955, partial [Deltaproteobacteria bacterium]|nr:hypothetical protein [Deltaproteobacteria bacterium]